MTIDGTDQIIDSILLTLLESDEDEEWIGVDLDGTLAKYNGWKGSTRIGEPVPAMVKRIRRWVGHGKKVKIFTARADDEKSVNAIKKWLKANELPDLEITNLKDCKMTELWDDRAVAVEKNTGAVKEAYGADDKPSYAFHDDDDTELEVAARSPFTAHDLALRRNKHHPRLWQRIKGSPYEREYRQKFNPTEAIIAHLLENDGEEVDDPKGLLDNLVTCPVCQGSCQSPYSPSRCSCCEGSGSITSRKFEALAKIRKDISSRLKESQLREDEIDQPWHPLWQPHPMQVLWFQRLLSRLSTRAYWGTEDKSQIYLIDKANYTVTLVKGDPHDKLHWHDKNRVIFGILGFRVIDGTEPPPDEMTVTEALLVESPRFETLKSNRVDLDPEERRQVMAAKAVWPFGKKGADAPAIHKSVVKGKTWYWSYTHRCYHADPTLKSAIKSYRDIVEPSA